MTFTINRRLVLLYFFLLSAPLTAQEAISSDPPLPGHWPADLLWQDVFKNSNRRKIRTRAGELAITYSGEIESEDKRDVVFTAFTLNEEAIHEAVSRWDIYYINIKALFRLQDQDVVVLALSNGGTGSPPPSVWLITIDDQGHSDFIKDTALRSGDWTYRFASDQQRLYMDFGYYNKQRRLAVFSPEGLSIDSSEASDEVLLEVIDAETCQQLYRPIELYCIHAQSLNNSTLQLLTALNHKPGFSRNDVFESCEAAGKSGLAPDYETFRRKVCLP